MQRNGFGILLANSAHGFRPWKGRQRVAGGEAQRNHRLREKFLRALEGRQTSLVCRPSRARNLSIDLPVVTLRFTTGYRLQRLQGWRICLKDPEASHSIVAIVVGLNLA